MAYKEIVKWLTPNPYSRPQRPLESVKALVIHWTASPMGTAQGVWNYFERRKDGKNDYGSAHETICLNGDVWRQIPSNEMAYAVGSETYTQSALNRFGSYPNLCTYSIELCVEDDRGNMTTETYNSAVERCADLCLGFTLDPLKDLWLHRDIVGWKDCHRFFVNNPKEWELFKSRVLKKMNEKLHPVQQEVIKMLEQWEKDLGVNAVDALTKVGLIQNPEDWKAKLGDATPNWLFFEMLRRVLEKGGHC